MVKEEAARGKASGELVSERGTLDKKREALKEMTASRDALTSQLERRVVRLTRC